MNAAVSCLLYSTSPDWTARMTGCLSSSFTVTPIATPARLDSELGRHGVSILLLDLQSEGALERLPTIVKAGPARTVIAFGMPGSDPVLEAERLDVYAVEDANIDRKRLVSLVQRAVDFLALAQENGLLRIEAAKLATLSEAALHRPAEETAGTLEVRHFSKALRHLSNVETLLHRLADEVASSLKVTRVGIFSRSRDTEPYRLRAGLRCIENTEGSTYADDDPLVRWLAIQAHVISRSNLEHVKEHSTRLMLTCALDCLGAEIIVPLQSRERLLGWLFVGHLSTGLPFEHGHIESLIEITECVSTALDNALLYEEMTIQKTLAETLLHSMPTGIIAVDADGVVRWFNEAAQQMLGIESQKGLAHPVEVLGTRVADVLWRVLRNDPGETSAEWLDVASRRSYSVRAQRLVSRSQCLGAVASLQDTTDQKMLKEKQDRLDRATFWAELAASMSHEVRNPLVTIKTFAQLLPERYQDREFQTEFRELVSREVDRLNSIIDQINDFAHPPKLEFAPVDLRSCIDKAVAAVLPKDTPGSIRLRVSAPDSLPRISGDEIALTHAFGHILQNAVEALNGRDDREIEIILRLTVEAGMKTAVEVVFRDNGPGIPADQVEKVFSPFATSKPRGLGLGLPIVKRTVVDHNGTVRIQSDAQGTCVIVVLPAGNGGT